MNINYKELSLIIPCYNSAKFLEKELPFIIGYLNDNIPLFELILIDDGSVDSDAVGLLAKKHNCIFWGQPHNMGKGAALRQGFKMASGQVQVFTDSDFPFEPAAIKHTVEIILAAKAAVVIGDRTNPLSEYYIKVSWTRKMGSYLIAGFGKRLLKNNIVDTQCGLKGFSKEAARILFTNSITNRFGIDFEILLLASRLGLSIRKIPVRLRTNYPSSVNVVGDGVKIIVEIFRAVRHHAKNKNLM